MCNCCIYLLRTPDVQISIALVHDMLQLHTIVVHVCVLRTIVVCMRNMLQLCTIVVHVCSKCARSAAVKHCLD